MLAQIARELVAVMRRDIKTDWTVRDDVRAKLRSSIKRLLVKYKYPPDKQPAAHPAGHRADGSDVPYPLPLRRGGGSAAEGGDDVGPERQGSRSGPRLRGPAAADRCTP